MSLCWNCAGGAAEKVIYLLVFHPIITFLADRLWNNKRIFLHMQKHQYDAKNLSFIPIYWQKWFQEINPKI